MASRGMPEYYIYYRARAADEARVMALVLAWQDTLCARWPGCSARLLKRPLEAVSNDTQTWMETYRLADDGHAEELAAGPPSLATLLLGQRHVEVFMPCAS